MIIGSIENLTSYTGLHEGIDRAIEFLQNLSPATPDGKYEIDGDRVYANIVTVTAADPGEIRFEAHRKYLDLQYILSGSETAYFAPLSHCKPVTEYDADKDFLFLSGEGIRADLGAGSFYLLHPHDAHAPGFRFRDNKLRKVIVKIRY